MTFVTTTPSASSEARKAWRQFAIRSVLRRIKEVVHIDDAVTYKRLTVKLNGLGVVTRDRALGATIGTKKQFRVRAGMFLLSKIDARNGAFGIVPPECDGAIITGNFWAFEVDERLLNTTFLRYLAMRRLFIEFCIKASEGTTNRRYLQEQIFLKQELSLPPLAEQKRLVDKIEQFTTKIGRVRTLHGEIAEENAALLGSRFREIANHAPLRPMVDIAPLVRRPVQVDIDHAYPELGVRSFGKGTFHKPALMGIDVGNKKLYEMQEGDLVFNNVFAWEGAVAVVKPADDGRVGSHRFIVRVPKSGVATSEFLRFFFLTPEGLKLLGEASPGGAGRNRTLGLKKLDTILVPLPTIDQQEEFDDLQAKMDSLKDFQEKAAAELDALLPSILAKAFKGEL